MKPILVRITPPEIVFSEKNTWKLQCVGGRVRRTSQLQADSDAEMHRRGRGEEVNSHSRLGFCGSIASQM